MFYSDKDFVQDGLTSSTLFDDKITLDFNEIVYFKEDDPDTDDVDDNCPTSGMERSLADDAINQNDEECVPK